MENATDHTESDRSPDCIIATTGLADLDADVGIYLFSWLPPRSVVAVGMTCSSLHGLARCDELWRMVARTRRPRVDGIMDEHADAAFYDKDARWLYAAATTDAPKERHPDARIVARLTSSDSRITYRGELVSATLVGHFDAPRDKAQDSDWYPDGYGLCIEVDRGRRTVAEGVWCSAKFVGPGRIAYAHGSRTWCDSWSGSRVNLRARIGIVASAPRPNGFGWCDRIGRSGMIEVDYWGEFRNGSPFGRGIKPFVDPDGSVGTFSGQFDGERLVGVVCREDGVIAKGRWRNGSPVDAERPMECAVDRSGWNVVRRHSAIERYVCLAGDPANGGYDDDDEDGAGAPPSSARHRPSLATTVHDNGSTTLNVDNNYTRVEFPDGSVVVGGVDTIALIAVPDSCPDERLAGRRFMCRSPAAWSGVGMGILFGAVPSDPRSHEARAFAHYLTSPHCRIEPETASVCLAALWAKADAAGVDLAWMPDDDSHHRTNAEWSGSGIGQPFGMPLSHLAATTTTTTETVSPANGPMVRCFLTGALVAAGACVLLSSGRAYESDAATRWTAIKGCGALDPETGETLIEGIVVPCHRWMDAIPRRAFDSTLRLGVQSARTVPARYRSTVVEDVVRYHALAAASTGGGGGDDDNDSPVTGAKAAGDARDPSGPLKRGFDLAYVRDVEMRHPDWDPRGPWRLSPPQSPPPDPTAEGIRTLASDATTAVVDLASASFLGAHLVGVFFFGQRFDGASFAHARLDRCAFIGCRFKGCVFAGALLTACAFHDCREAVGSSGGCLIGTERMMHLVDSRHVV